MELTEQEKKVIMAIEKAIKIPFDYKKNKNDMLLIKVAPPVHLDSDELDRAIYNDCGIICTTMEMDLDGVYWVSIDE